MGESGIIKRGSIAVLMMISDFIYPLRWFFLVSVVLVAVDLRFGIKAAQKRGEEIRRSRASRRTVNKALDYMSWITVAGAVGKAFAEPFGIPLLPCIMMAVICSVEIDSCFSNYCEYRGLAIKISISNLIMTKLGIKKTNNGKN